MRLLFALLALIAFVPSVYAASNELTGAARAAAIQDAERYFNAVTTVKARFAQMNQDGTISSGVFTWWRPGRLRFQYDPPNGDYIVADGLLVHYWDDGVKNYSNAPISTTLANFLLRKTIKLSGDLRVVGVTKPAPDKLLVTLVQSENPDAGDLRLLFGTKPFQLQKWRVTEATGQVTEIMLSHIQPGVKLDPRDFRFKPPAGYDAEWKNR